MTRATIASLPDANARSAQVRGARAAIKAEISKGSRRVERTILEPCPIAKQMYVRDLLLSLPQVGRTEMNSICIQAGVLPTHRLSEITLYERRQLILALPARVTTARVWQEGRS